MAVNRAVSSHADPVWPRPRCRPGGHTAGLNDFTDKMSMSARSCATVAVDVQQLPLRAEQFISAAYKTTSMPKSLAARLTPPMPQNRSANLGVSGKS